MYYFHHTDRPCHINVESSKNLEMFSFFGQKKAGFESEPSKSISVQYHFTAIYIHGSLTSQFNFKPECVSKHGQTGQFPCKVDG